MLFIDHVNRAIPEHHKLAGLQVKMSNLCSEITLPTGKDHLGNDRTAVCCLSSLNLETWEQWQDEPGFVEDVLRMLDNVLTHFITVAPDSMARARYSATSFGAPRAPRRSRIQAVVIPSRSRRQES